MARTTSALVATGGVAVLAALLVPTGGAAAADSCTAWGTLPARVTLGPHGATVRTTLHGSSACTSASLDNGATAVLVGPQRNDNAPMRWGRFGDTDEATYYPTINHPGTYRLVDGDVQTYDAQSVRIPSRWYATATVVKYRGRLREISVGGSGVTATLQAYGRSGWAAQAGVRVALQHRDSAGRWHDVARSRTASDGWVRIAATVRASGDYRLASATTTDVWGTARTLARAGT